MKNGRNKFKVSSFNFNIYDTGVSRLAAFTRTVMLMFYLYQILRPKFIYGNSNFLEQKYLPIDKICAYNRNIDCMITCMTRRYAYIPV